MDDVGTRTAEGGPVASPPDAERAPARRDAPGTPTRRWGPLLWVLVGIGVLVAIAFAVRWRAQSLADETIARHRTKYLAEVAVLAAKPRGRAAILEPADAGSAEDVRRAFLAALAAVPKDERDEVKDRRWEVHGATEREEEEKEEARILDAHPEVVAPLESLLRVPSRPTLPPVSLDNADSVQVKETIEATAWLLAGARRAVSRGDREEGLRLATLGCALGADYARIGPIVTWMVGGNVHDDSLRVVRDVLRTGPLTPAESGTLARVVDGLETSEPTLVDVLDFERAAFRGSWTEIEGDAVTDVGWRHLWSLRVYLAAGLDAWDGAADRLREIAAEGRASPQEALEGARRLDEAQETASIVRMVTVLGPRLVRRDAEVRTTWTLARAAIAVASFRAEKGRLPTSLDELVPTYLPRVPIDPWDGKPLRWSAEGGVIWSVGSSGRDDGVPPADDPEDKTSWRIWGED